MAQKNFKLIHERLWVHREEFLELEQKRMPKFIRNFEALNN